MADYMVRYIVTKGKRRRIVTYGNEEKRQEHNEIKLFLEEKLIFSKFTKAYIAYSSIYKNAKAHMYNDIFIKYDIEKYFDSINHKILVRILHEQLNLGQEKEIYTIFETSELVGNCIFGKKGLPLGLITSPVLSNIYLKTFDNILYGKLKKMKLENVIYTRYADDLTISFKNSSRKSLEDLDHVFSEIESLINLQLKNYKLKLNANKKSIISLDVSNHVRITGISITKLVTGKRRLSVGKKKVIKLFDDALQLYYKKIVDADELSNEDLYNIQRVKGMESFVLSIHKTGYNHMFSEKMQDKLLNLGFKSLHELIESL
ncbi:reverse transcriptase domain-containing protein [Cohnella faecalis]|nr:reverse transcriptase domain-containing protein [Cohnella faecalis]